MPFVSTFGDRQTILGRGAIGSVQLADRAVTRIKVALSAVGSGEMGTYSLAKSVGTVSNIDVGTIVASYGSHGTIAARAARFGYGSNTGTMRAPLYRGRHGSFTGTVEAPLHVGRQGSYAGTVNSPFMRGRHGSWSGSIQAPRITGQIGSFNRLAGTLGATRITHGTLGASRQGPLQSIPGTLTIDTKAQGTLALQRLPRQVTDRGTISGQVGSFARGRVDGTMTVRYGSFQRLAGTLGATRITHGTLAVARHQSIQNLQGTLPIATKTSGTLDVSTRALGTLALQRLPANITGRGTINARYGSVGTIASPIHRGRHGSWSGTVNSPFMRGRHGSWSGSIQAPRITGQIGSFNRLAGTLGATRITHGTLARQRVPVPLLVRYPSGTTQIGSWRNPGGTPTGLAFSARGDAWLQDNVRLYIYRVGTFPIRAGTASRIGTTYIGSVRAVGTQTPDGLGFSPRGHLWTFHTGGGGEKYFTRLGTLGLRAGTPSRIGTVRIGSISGLSTQATGCKFTRRGHLLHTRNDQRYVYLVGTGGLTAGTNSRMGSTLIGSFRHLTGSPTSAIEDPLGGWWVSTAHTRYIHRYGTLGLRAGTNSYMGTRLVGSIRSPAGTPRDMDFSTRGDLWISHQVGGRIFRVGTSDWIPRRASIVQAPPTVGRRVSITAQLNPDVTTASRILISQARLGTLAQALEPGAGPVSVHHIAADIVPGYGSWRVGTVNLAPTIQTWRETTWG